MKRFLATACTVVLLSACSCGQKISGGSAASSSTAVHPTSDMVSASSVNEELKNKIGDRVFFALNSAELTQVAKDTLNKQADLMSQHPNMPFTVEGHADERGTREYNLGLGERRAHSAKSYLVQKGVNASHLNTVSYGKERPAVHGHDESIWKQNRRAVTVVQSE
ncbi:Peptidoglycan-associated protein [Alphaproteobacteria bacterium]